MSKILDIQKELKLMQERIILLEETKRRLEVFDGLNDGSALLSVNKRLLDTNTRMSMFIENNLEYVI